MKYKGVAVQETTDGGCSYFVRCMRPRTSEHHSRTTVGTYYSLEEAARAYDLALLALGVSYRGTNFDPAIYSQPEIQAMKEHLSKPPNVKSSKFIGVRSKGGQWDARLRIGAHRVHLGYYGSEQDAAVQYDLAQLVVHKLDAAVCASKLNFDWSDYTPEQVNTLTTNVRLRLSQKLGPDTVEQQLQQQQCEECSTADQQGVLQTQGPVQQLVKQEPWPAEQLQEPKQQCHEQLLLQQQGLQAQEQLIKQGDMAGKFMSQQQQQQRKSKALKVQQRLMKDAKRRAKQELKEARAALLQAKQGLHNQQHSSKKQRKAAKAAKKAAKAAVAAVKQSLKALKQDSVVEALGE